MKYIFTCFLSLLIVGVGCENHNKTDKIQDYSINIENINENIVDINTNVLFGAIVRLDIANNYLIVTDIQSTDKGVHLYDKSTYEYVSSAAAIGRGPSEITRIGPISIDHKNRILWIPDYGKEATWKFPLDSIVQNPMYKPSKKINFNKDYFFGNSFNFLNDSIAIGDANHLINDTEFVMMMAKFNINNNESGPYGYLHPEATGPRSHFRSKVSIENNIYANAYNRVNLITICDLDGNLKYNIYGGDDWFNKNKKKSYFEQVDFYENYILASYNGDERIVYNENKRPEVVAPSKIIVFDLEGNYEKTIDTGAPFSAFCVDKENKRLIAYFENREHPLGYFNLDL